MSAEAPSISPIPLRQGFVGQVNGGGCTYRKLRKSGDRVRGLAHYTERQRKLRNDGTIGEKVLWELLRGKRFHGKKFRRRHGVGPYIVDFYCDELKLIIEIDGSVHNTEEAKGYDKERDQYFMSLDYSVLHLSNQEVIDTPSIALKKIEGTSGVYPPPFTCPTKPWRSGMGEMEGARI